MLSVLAQQQTPFSVWTAVRAVRGAKKQERTTRDACRVASVSLVFLCQQRSASWEKELNVWRWENRQPVSQSQICDRDKISRHRKKSVYEDAEIRSMWQPLFLRPRPSINFIALSAGRNKRERAGAKREKRCIHTRRVCVCAIASRARRKQMTKVDISCRRNLIRRAALI
jgi:hypothetical protein